MKKSKISMTVKIALASILSIGILSVAFIGANHFIFRSATDPQIVLPQTTAAAAVLSRIDAVPEDYPFPEFIVNELHSDYTHMKSPNALSAQQAAEVGARYIWEMFGEDISGSMVSIFFSMFPSSTRTHWSGAVWAWDDPYHVSHFRFTIDAVTGERISIHDLRRDVIREIEESVFDGCYLCLVEINTQIALEYARRHFNFTDVVSVTHMDTWHTIQFPNDSGVRVRSGYMAYEQLGVVYQRQLHALCSMCIDDDAANISHLVAISPGKTMMHFTAADETGRSAQMAVTMGTGRLQHLITEHNDILPGFEIPIPTPVPEYVPWPTPMPGDRPTPGATPVPGRESWPTPTPQPTPYPNPPGTGTSHAATSFA